VPLHPAARTARPRRRRQGPRDPGAAPSAHRAAPSGPRCKAIAAARLKNDKVDAATLAQLLRAELLPEAWIAPPEIRDLRALLRHRASLVRLATELKNRVHAMLADRGMAARSSLWTTPGRAWLQALELPPTPRAIIDDCCGVLDALATPIGRLEREIGALAKPDHGSRPSWPCPASASSPR
jgi:transposase